MSASLAIDLHNVSKNYGRRLQALREVSLQIGRGEIFGLLGPNGAGKSTLVKILMTVIRATKAEGTLLGRPIGHKATLAQVGYLPEHHRMPPYLTGRQAIDFFAALSKVDRAKRRKRIAELLPVVGMEDRADDRISTYSKGMQQRIGLAQALVNDPQLVLLDEPTDGLDPVGRKEIRNVLLRLRDEGKTVFLNSHLLGEMERVCDRVAILIGGRVVRQGSVEDLTVNSQCYEIELAVSPFAQDALISSALEWQVLDVVPPDGPMIHRGVLATGDRAEVKGTLVRIFTIDAGRIQPVIDRLRGSSLVIQAVRPVRQSLEDFFIQMVEDSAPRGGAAIRGGAE
jgi:ABC-2 type transport system ATP-binding protein